MNPGMRSILIKIRTQLLSCLGKLTMKKMCRVVDSKDLRLIVHSSVGSREPKVKTIDTPNNATRGKEGTSDRGHSYVVNAIQLFLI